MISLSHIFTLLVVFFTAFRFIPVEIVTFFFSTTRNVTSPDGIIFFITGFISAVFYFRLAQEWPEIMQSIAKNESIFQKFPYTHNPGWSVKKKIRVSSAVLLMFAVCEHTTAWTSFLYDRLTQSRVCNWEIGSYFYYLATTHAHQVYRQLPVNIWTVLWAEYMNASMTLIWSFNDLFIMIVSFRIASMFAKINNRLELYRGRVSADDWPDT